MNINVWEDYELNELEMPSSCAELHCSGSARCVIDERTRHARCRCPLGTSGVYCEQGQCLHVTRTYIAQTMTIHLNQKDIYYYLLKTKLSSCTKFGSIQQLCSWQLAFLILCHLCEVIALHHINR